MHSVNTAERKSWVCKQVPISLARPSLGLKTVVSRTTPQCMTQIFTAHMSTTPPRSHTDTRTPRTRACGRPQSARAATESSSKAHHSKPSPC